MIRWILIFAISLTPAVGSAQEAAAPAHRQPVDAKILGLQLTIAISGEKFCSGDADVYTEALNLDTVYANQGKTPLTIFLGTDFAPRVLVARTAEDLKAARYESEQNADYYPMDGGRYMLGSDPRSERAVVLAPGESVKGKSGTSVVVRKSSSARVAGSIASGTHYLEVGMLIKVSEDDAADETVHRRGRRANFHWVSVSSEPVRFEVPVSPTLQDCAK